jgi:hypothetical protein
MFLFGRGRPQQSQNLRPHIDVHADLEDPAGESRRRWYLHGEKPLGHASTSAGARMEHKISKVEGNGE